MIEQEPDVLDVVFSPKPEPTLGDLGFKHLPDSDIQAGYDLLEASRGFGTEIRPGFEDIPFLGVGFENADLLSVKAAQARMQRGRATLDDERQVFQFLVNEARTVSPDGTVAGLMKQFVTTGAEFAIARGVAGAVGAGAKAGARKALGEATRAAVRRQMQTAVGRMLTRAVPIATQVATVTGLQEAVPQAAGALGMDVAGGAWTGAAIRQVLGEEMTDEEAERIADDVNAALPVMLEKAGGIWNGLARTAIENVSETTGGALSKLPPFQQINAVIGGLAKKLSPRAASVGWAKAFAEAARFDGPGGELAEEYLSAVASSVLMGDDLVTSVAQVTEIAPELLVAASVFPVGGALAERATSRGSVRGSMVAPGPEAPAAEGGDPSAAASVPVGGEAAASEGAPSGPDAGLEALRRGLRERTGADVEVTPVEPRGIAEEAAVAFAQRRGYRVQFYERGDAPDGAQAAEDGFFPGQGDTVYVRRGAPDVGAAAVHEGIHLWESQQTPERRAELSAALRAIDGRAVAEIAKGLARSPLYRGRPAAELESEVRAGVAQAVSGVVRMLDTEAGRKAFADLAADPGGPVRRLLTGLYDWVADVIRVLPRSKRARARAALRLARGEDNAARLAQRVLDALNEVDVRPIESVPVSAGEELGLGPDEGMADQGVPPLSTPDIQQPAAEVRGKSAAGAPRPVTTTKAERRAAREARKAERKAANTPMPGDTVEYMRRSSNGATIKVTGRVKDVLGPADAPVWVLRINEDVARAGEARRSPGENRARRAESEVRVTERGRLRVLAVASTLDPTSKTAKRRAEAEKRYLQNAPKASAPAKAGLDTEGAPQKSASAEPETVVGAGAPPIAEESTERPFAARVRTAARHQSRYMGNKKEFLLRNAGLLESVVKALPERPVIYDMYAGGGAYGLSLAATGVVPNASKVIINEVDPARYSKTKRALQEGGAFIREEWDSNKVLRDLRAEMRRVIEDKKSMTPAATAFKVAAGMEDSPTYVRFQKYRAAIAALSPRATDALMAVADVLFANRGGSHATNTEERKERTFEKFWSIATDDANNLNRLSAMARARGVEVTMTAFDSVSDEAVRFVADGAPGLALLDPPYHETTTGTYSAGGRSYRLNSDEFMDMTMDAARRMAPGHVALYHNKATTETVQAWRSMFGSTAATWSRQNGQPEIAGVHDGTREARNAGSGRGGAVRGDAPARPGGTGKRGVLARHGGAGAWRGTERRAGRSDAGAGAAYIGGRGAEPRFAAALYNQMPAMVQRPLRHYLDGFRRLFQDNTIPLREKPDVRTNVKRYRAQMPDRLRRFEQRLEAMLAPFKGEQLDDVQRAVYLQAAIQRNAWMLQERGVQDGAGISTADAQSELAILAQALGQDRLDALLQEHAALNAERLAHMEEAGFITPQQVADWAQREPNWVSMRDVDPDADDHLGFGASGRSMQVRNPQVRAAQGRMTEVENPLLAWASEYAMRIVSAEKNKALRAAAAAGVTSVPKPQGVPGGFTAPETHVAYVDGGQQMYLQMDTEQQAEVLKGLDGETLGLVTKMFGAVTRTWGRAVTGQNPAFWLFNFLRDTSQAGFFTLAERGVGYAARTYARAWAVLPRMIRYQLNGDATGMPMLDTAQRRGFKTTWAGRRSLREQLNWMRDQVEGRSGVRAKLRAVLGFLEQVGDAFEMASRYATFESEYQRQVQAGATQEEAEQLAADYAREITLNFDTKGSLTTHASAFYAFFNPAMQGSARLMQVALSKRGAAFMGALITSGYLMEALNYALADDDERTGLNLYGSLPEWEKSRNIILPIWKDKQPLKITLPYGLDAVWGLGRRLFLLTSGKDVDPRIEAKKVVWEGMLQAATSFNPLGDISDPYSMVTPTVVRPFVEIDRNRKFGDRPIMKPGESFGRAVPDSARAFETLDDRASGWLAQHIADVLNFNGPEELPTGLDVSPESVQHLIEFLGAGFGLRELDRLSEYALSDRKPVPGANVPVLRGFVGAVTDHYISELYYEIAEHGSLMHSLAANPANAGRMETIAERDRMAWRMRSRVARTDRKLSDLRRKLRADGTSQEEAEKIRERMTEIQAGVVRAYYGTQK